MVTGKKAWRSAAGPAIGLSIGLLFAILAAAGVFERLELWTLDLRQRVAGETELSPRILVIDVDETSLKLLGWPISRAVYANLVNAAKRHGAASVTFDILFSDVTEGDEGGDDALLARAASDANNVIFPSELGFGDKTEGTKASIGRSILAMTGSRSLLPEATTVVAPIPELSKATSSAAHLQLDSRPDGVFRRAPLLIRYADELVPSLALAAAGRAASPDQLAVTLAHGTLGVSTGGGASWSPIPVDAQGRALIRFRAVTRVLAYRLADVVDALLAEAEGKPSSLDLATLFKNRIVLVGSTAPTLGDHGPTPFSNSSPLLLVHANVVDNILTHGFLRPAPRWLNVVLLLVLCSVVGFAVGRWRVLTGTLVGLVTGVAVLVGTYLAFSAGSLHLDLAALLSGLALTFVSVMVFNHYVRDAQERLVRQAFDRFVAPHILERLVDDPGLIGVGGTRKTITMLFSDIKGYTTLSNKLSPNEILVLLHDYLDKMVEIIFEFEGTVDKIMGDGIMAFFGDPVACDDHAAKAVRCAMKMHEELAILAKKWQGEARERFDIRVGLATGEVYVGNIGSRQHLEYTVIGPAVNLASRLESNCDPGRVFVSEETYEAVKGEIRCRKTKGLKLKGYAGPYEAYMVLKPGESEVGPAEVPAADNRRNSPRLPRMVNVRYAVGGTVVSAKSLDVSADGMFVATPAPPEVGTEVALFFDVAGDDGKPTPVRLEAVVKHRRTKGGEGTGMGVLFTQISSESTGSIRAFLADVLGDAELDNERLRKGTDELGRDLFRYRVSAEYKQVVELALQGLVGAGQQRD